MSPPPPAAPVSGLPRSDTVNRNLASLCTCCREPFTEPDPVEHPHRPFMERAIELSRIGGIEKRTGGCFGAVVVRNGVVSFSLSFWALRSSSAPVGADVSPRRKPSPVRGAPRAAAAPAWTGGARRVEAALPRPHAGWRGGRVGARARKKG